MDWISYAKRIQQAILPNEKLVKESLPDSFILYQPKEILAGDFYWVESIDDWVIFAAADCIGHGVPGAMVSVVCHNALNRSVFELGLKRPCEILNATRSMVVQSLQKGGMDVKDGMDISLCCWNKKTKTLEFAGANNPLWLVMKKKNGRRRSLCGRE